MDTRHKLGWEATKAFKAGLIDKAALETIRRLVRERGAGTDEKISTFAQAFFARVGAHDGLAELGGSAAPAVFPLALPASLLLCIWRMLDDASQVAVLCTSRALVAAMFPNAAEKQQSAAALLRADQDTDGVTQAAQSCLPALMDCGNELSSTVFLQRLIVRRQARCDFVLASYVIAHLVERHLGLHAYLVDRNGLVCANSSQALSLVTVGYENDALVFLFANNASPCAIVVGQTHFALRALSKDNVSIGTVVDVAAAVQVSSRLVRLASRTANGSAGITLAGPRTARFLGQALHGNPEHFLTEGGVVSSGSHGQANWGVTGYKEASTYQRQRYLVGSGMFELHSPGVQITVHPRIVFDFCFGATA